VGAIRRTLVLCAGLLAAAGCTPAAYHAEAAVPLASGQDPARTSLSPPAAPAPAIPDPPANLRAGRGPLPDAAPPAEPADAPLPINLATALQLGNARPLDVQIAGRQVAAAAAALDRARLLWVPNLVLGTDYFAHTGPQQNFAGEILKSTRSTFMAGLGPAVVFSFSDAVYAPLAARQDVRARQATHQAAVNDTTLQVAEAYFAVQQARGQLAGELLAATRAEDLLRRATALVQGLAPPPEETRARVELARRRQAVAAARERWRTASAELTRLLRLDPAAVVEPVEPPFLPVTVIDPSATVDTLIPIALSARPELAGQQAVVQATLARLKQEKLRPLVPSLALRGASTNPSGSLGYGVFGGGRNDVLEHFAGRFDIDMQLLWEFQALGFGNRARVNERSAEYEIATLELFRTQDRIAAEVARAYAEARAAAERLNEAEPALRDALDLVDKNIEGLGQTRRAGELLVLVVRPQEAIAAVQALAQANADFAAAVADYNRAQFRLYRALGHPAQCLAGSVGGEPMALPEPRRGIAPPVPPPGPDGEKPAQPDPPPGAPGMTGRPADLTEFRPARSRSGEVAPIPGLVAPGGPGARLESASPLPSPSGTGIAPPLRGRDPSAVTPADLAEAAVRGPGPPRVPPTSPSPGR
jgi:outer membrane protein TolC